MNALELKAASVAAGGELAARGLDFSLGAGERLLAFGASAAALRAVLRVAAGLERPSAGCATLPGGEDKPVGYAAAEGGLLNNLSLLSNAALPAYGRRLLGARQARARAAELLSEWGVADEADKRPVQTSVPARRMAKLARAVLAEPALFVIEDPLRELEGPALAAVRRALDAVLSRKDAAVFLTSQSPARYLGDCGRFLFVSADGCRLFSDRAALLACEDREIRGFFRRRTGD